MCRVLLNKIFILNFNGPFSSEELAPPVYKVVNATQSILQSPPLDYVVVVNSDNDEDADEEEEEEEQPKACHLVLLCQSF